MNGDSQRKTKIESNINKSKTENFISFRVGMLEGFSEVSQIERNEKNEQKQKKN